MHVFSNGQKRLLVSVIWPTLSVYNPRFHSLSFIDWDLVMMALPWKFYVYLTLGNRRVWNRLFTTEHSWNFEHPLRAAREKGRVLRRTGLLSYCSVTLIHKGGVNNIWMKWSSIMHLLNDKSTPNSWEFDAFQNLERWAWRHDFELLLITEWLSTWLAGSIKERT